MDRRDWTKGLTKIIEQGKIDQQSVGKKEEAIKSNKTYERMVNTQSKSRKM